TVPSSGLNALRLLSAVGATYDVVSSVAIADTISRRVSEFEAMGHVVRIVAGGAHSKAGVEAYVQAGRATFEEVQPRHVVLASGTGATQAGLHIAASASEVAPTVVGVSVARSIDR